MLIDFTPRDRGIVDAGLKIHEKMLETIVKQLERVALATLQPAGELERVQHLRGVLTDEYLDSSDLAFSRNFVDADRLTLGISVSLYLEKVGKIEDAQKELTIETADTDERITQAQDLADRLKGQASLDLDAREYDDTEVTISGDGLARPIQTTTGGIRRATERMQHHKYPRP